MVRLFRSKDVDGSGTLDMQEFVELVRGSTWYSYGAIVVRSLSWYVAASSER